MSTTLVAIFLPRGKPCRRRPSRPFPDEINSSWKLQQPRQSSRTDGSSACVFHATPDYPARSPGYGNGRTRRRRRRCSMIDSHPGRLLLSLGIARRPLVVRKVNINKYPFALAPARRPGGYTVTIHVYIDRRFAAHEHVLSSLRVAQWGLWCRRDTGMKIGQTRACTRRRFKSTTTFNIGRWWKLFVAGSATVRKHAG